MLMSTNILQIKRTNDAMEELTAMSVNRSMELKITKKLLAVILVFAIKSILYSIFLGLLLKTKNGFFHSAINRRF